METLSDHKYICWEVSALPEETQPIRRRGGETSLFLCWALGRLDGDVLMAALSAIAWEAIPPRPCDVEGEAV